MKTGKYLAGNIRLATLLAAGWLVGCAFMPACLITAPKPTVLNTPAAAQITSNPDLYQSVQDSLRPKGGALLHTLPRTARFFTVDKLQQVYLVDEQNAVFKYSPDGKELFYYNNNTRGELEYIDVTDPFNLLLFYPELQAIATLDRTLNETGVLPLFSAGIVNATAMGLAIDNNIWVYDQATFQLKKVGQNGHLLLTSDNLSAQLSQAPQATQLAVQNNKLYLNCPGQGVFVFDNFGQFYQLLPYASVQYVQLREDKVVLYEEDRVRLYNTKTLRESTLRDTMHQEDVRQLRYQGKRYYQLNADGRVEVFEMK